MRHADESHHDLQRRLDELSDGITIVDTRVTSVSTELANQVSELGNEIDALGEQLETRKTIDRAKGLLIDECDMRESDAFAFIQRTAMSERTKMREVAERILDGSLRP